MAETPPAALDQDRKRPPRAERRLRWVFFRCPGCSVCQVKPGFRPFFRCLDCLLCQLGLLELPQPTGRALGAALRVAALTRLKFAHFPVSGLLYGGNPAFTQSLRFLSGSHPGSAALTHPIVNTSNIAQVAQARSERFSERVRRRQRHKHMGSPIGARVIGLE
jgi:hypothetical protein